MASSLKSSIANTLYYTTLGKQTAFPSDAIPPDPTDAVKSSHYDVYSDMLFGKRILPDDVRIMCIRNDWTSGTVYKPYDHEAADLYDYEYRFYVVVDEGSSYTVFKCLDNNNGSPSTYKPSLYETSADDTFYMTADGYQWKYMYSISRADFEKFATSHYVPINANTSVTGNATPGAIETIRVVEAGNRYNSFHSGSIQAARVGGNNQLYTIEPSASSNTDFYKNCVLKITTGPGAGQQRVVSEYIVSGGVKRVLLSSDFNPVDLPTEESTYEITPHVIVTGDGSGFEGRALVNAVSNSVYAVEITNKGSSYSWADAVVVGNTGIINSASNTYIQTNNAILRAIISPPGGHGSNIETELGGNHLGLAITLNTTEAGGKLVADNDFRRVAVIKQPKFANVQINITANTGLLNVGEVLVQADTGAYGTITVANSSSVSMTDVVGIFASGNSSYGIVAGNTSGYTAVVTGTNSNNPSLYFDQTYTLEANLISSMPFIDDELVYQGSHANGFVYFANTSMLKINGVKGTFNIAETNTSSGIIHGQSSLAAANVTHIKIPDLVYGSGEVLYIENITPIARSNGQTETIKVIVEF